MKQLKTIPKGWVKYKLGELGYFKTSSVNKKINPNEKEVNLINYMDVYRHRFIDNKINYMLVTANDHEKEVSQVEEGDILFTPSSETPDDIGHSAVVFDNLPNTLYSYHLVRLKIKKEISIDLKFRGYFCNSRLTLKHFEKLATGVTRFTLSKKDFEEAEVIFPKSIKEQNKIAEILSKVDEDIEKTDEIIQKTERLKKGLMQELLNSGSKIKNGNLGDHVLHVGSGATPRGGSKIYLSEGIPFIRSQNVYFRGLVVNNLVYISNSIHQQMQRSKVRSHDVLLNITGASIGRACIVPENFPESNVNQHVCIIRPNKDLLYKYLFYYLQSDKGQNQIFKFQIGGNREGLNFQQIRSMNIFLPTIKEQKQITEILSAIDNKIDINKQIKNKLTQLKKGLMNDLLSGEVRI